VKINKEKIQELIVGLDEMIHSAKELEKLHNDKISRVHPDHSQSAKNLIHYLALRQFDISGMQKKLWNLGLTPFRNIEPHIMRSLIFTKTILKHLIQEIEPLNPGKTISFKKSRRLINSNAQQLFGTSPKKRHTRIMVTIPSEAAVNAQLPEKYLKAGMNCARINCAHDNPDVWLKMIENIRSATAGADCRIMMDLSGPKLRTGAMSAGPKVLRIKPERNDLGRVVKPEMIWLAKSGHESSEKPFIQIPVDFYDSNLAEGQSLAFTDARGKICTLDIVEISDDGLLVASYHSAYISTGMQIFCSTDISQNHVVAIVGDLPPVEQSIILKPGDRLILHNDTSMPGENARYDALGRLLHHPIISCAMPGIFKDVKVGEPVLFDDGKIEGVIEKATESELTVLIVNSKETGTKLRAGKGINFPSSDLKITGLTQKDCDDLKFISRYADAVNVSFVNDAGIVNFILNQFEKLEKQPGLILKIETQKGFQNLPLILLEALRVKPVGVMIARGDLAVETGWNNMANVQEEILRICEAAHIPDIWATQVLENMAKKGIPSRAEITDAGVSERAECVMLNKGAQLAKAIKLLDKILCNMKLVNQQHGTLPRIENANQLLLQ
jgi:pyruvate kinase